MAVQRISNVVYFAVNGKVSSTTVSNASNFTGSSTPKLVAGMDYGAGSTYEGYVGSLRVVKGTGIYGTSNFNVPTAPLTNTGSQTIALLNFTNASIPDLTMKHNLITTGNAQISTSVKSLALEVLHLMARAMKL